MNDFVFEMLKNKSKVRSIRTDIVFSSRVETARNERNVRRLFEKAVKKTAIEDFKFHEVTNLLL